MAEDLRDVTLKLHFEAREKFAYYLLGLCLAILGFSVQFSEPARADIFPSFVFYSWTSFIASLLAGVWWQRLWIRLLKRLHSDLTRYLKSDPEEGQKDASRTGLEEEIGNLYKKLQIAESAQLGAFVLGLVLYATYKVCNFYGT